MRKKRACWTKKMRFGVYLHSNNTFRIIERSNSGDPTKEENTGFRWDSQHYQFNHCPGSGLKPSLRCTVRFPQFLKSLHILRETLLFFTLNNTAWALSERYIHKLSSSEFSPLGIHRENVSSRAFSYIKKTWRKRQWLIRTRGYLSETLRFSVTGISTKSQNGSHCVLLRASVLDLISR